MDRVYQVVILNPVVACIAARTLYSVLRSNSEDSLATLGFSTM